MFMMGYSDPRRPSADKLYGERLNSVTRSAACFTALTLLLPLCRCLWLAATSADPHPLARLTPAALIPAAACRVALPVQPGPLHLDLWHGLRHAAPQVRPGPGLGHMRLGWGT